MTNYVDCYLIYVVILCTFVCGCNILANQITLLEVYVIVSLVHHILRVQVRN